MDRATLNRAAQDEVMDAPAVIGPRPARLKGAPEVREREAGDAVGNTISIVALLVGNLDAPFIG